MLLRDVVVKWLEYGVEPGQLDSLTPSEKHEFIGDVFAAEPDWIPDSIGEGFVRNPAKAAEFAKAIGSGDLHEAGMVIYQVIRGYIFETCEEFWESEFTQVQEQESEYEEG